MNHHPNPGARVGALITLALLGTTGAGQAGQPTAGAMPTPRPLGSGLPVYAARDADPPPSPPAPPRELQGVLTLRQALAWTALHNPELAASAHGVRAAEQDARQAGAVPNPELEVEAEEFGGSDARSGYDGAVTTVRLSQSVELAGKRVKRRALAESETRLAGWEYEAKRLDVLTRTRKAFVDVLAAQGQLALADTALTLAGDVSRVATARVESGKVPPLERTRAEVEVASARIARDKAGRDLDTARRFLAAAWGDPEPRFAEAAGSWTDVGKAPALAALAAALEQSPEVVREADRVQASRQAVDLARAGRVPDLTVSAGLSRFEEDGTQAGLASLSLPLPLFDRNAGAILAARHRATRAAYDQQAARLNAVTALAEAHGRLVTAREQALALATELVPGAQQAFDGAQVGYREGKLGYLDVLDAQRTLGEARARHLEALADYHKAAADVERITGLSLDTIQ